jgi:bifunctional DNase/RNase
LLRPMLIWAIAVDSSTKSPVVILKEIDGERTIPIWIGFFEANAIVSELDGIKFPRPMTHDLLKNIIELIGAKVSRIVICALKDTTYYALMYINHNGKEISIDARPSDALALSLRVGAPILASEEVIIKSVQIDLEAEPADQSEQGKKWQEMLEKMSPEDFGNT